MRADPNTTTELFTPDELAQMLKISRSSVYRLVEQRQIPFYKVRRSLRFKQSDISAYLEQSRVGSVSQKQPWL